MKALYDKLNASPDPGTGLNPICWNSSKLLGVTVQLCLQKFKVLT